MGGEHPLASLAFGLQEPFLLMCGQGGLLTSRKKTCGLGRAQPPPLKLLLLSLSFDPEGMNLQSLYPGGPVYLLPRQEGA